MVANTGLAGECIYIVLLKHSNIITFIATKTVTAILI